MAASEKRTVTGRYQWGEGEWLCIGRKRDCADLVLSVLDPDESGVSRWVSIAELQEVVPREDHGQLNGNGSNMFTRGRGLGQDFLFDTRGRGMSLQVRAVGLRPQIECPPGISRDIYAEIVARRCVVLDTSQGIECDHKNGRKDDRRLEILSQQRLDDFQPMNRTVNAVKRTHCGRCRQTGKRYDARRRGYSHGWIVGGEDFISCHGCFWHDVLLFNTEMSKAFDPEAHGTDGRAGPSGDGR